MRLAEEKDIDDVEIDSKSLAALTAAFEQQQGTALKPGYELFDGEFDYGVLDCARFAQELLGIDNFFWENFAF